MTVTVTLHDGATENYMRFGDAYIKRSNGTLDVVRVGSKRSYSYPAGEWTDVEGDEKGRKNGH
jgi:hypothetical protein